MSKPLVIVESPSKAKTLGRFLGPGYDVAASYGHVRDLPESAKEAPKDVDKEVGRLGVDIRRDFAPLYVVPSEKKKRVQELRARLKDAAELLLATDPDREGESISWHLLEVLKPKKGQRVRRIVFHEITEEAIREALQGAHDIDLKLVDAQECRRILDRLFGYMVSPVLWRKVQTGLSAGRVQSVAVRLLVEREEERMRFRAASFWDLDDRLRAGDLEFTATLVRVDDTRLATGRDFAMDGRLTSDTVRLLGEDEARRLAGAFEAGLPWRVTAVDERPVTQRPAPPFTTSTLQQEANRKLGFSSQRTMDAAQRLFAEGHISYHRTDSTTLSDRALRESGRAIKSMYGEEYYQGPRQYQTRVRNAQEAHEAIRPTDFGGVPQQLERVLESDDLRVYELIWKRAIASQMADARLLRTTIEITAAGPDGVSGVFTASGKAIQFAGFLRAYVEGSDDPAADLGDQESLLPSVARGDLVAAPPAAEARLLLDSLEPKGHETSPPPRYTEASLVKRLEEDGIGRPSTYAPTIATIQRRGYVFKQGRALVPSFTAFAVTRLLRDNFGEYVDPGFTAEMEKDLDEISNGERGRLEFLREFYFGDEHRQGLEAKVQGDADIEYPVVEVGSHPETGTPIVVRIGRNGPFLQTGEGESRQTASVPEDLPPADLSPERAFDLLKQKAGGPRVLGTAPDGQAVYLFNGRFGPYVQLGETPEAPAGRAKTVAKPPRASVPSGMSADTITLEQALKFLQLPREIGRHPADDEPILANFGKFGPYVKHGSEFRSLESDEQVFTIPLDEAIALLAQPKRSHRRQAAARAVLRELGAHPESGAPVKLFSGRYGPYVSDGTTNASLPRGANPEAIPLEEAVALLRERAAAGPPKRRPARRAGATGRKAVVA